MKKFKKKRNWFRLVLILILINGLFYSCDNNKIVVSKKEQMLRNSSLDSIYCNYNEENLKNGLCLYYSSAGKLKKTEEYWDGIKMGEEIHYDQNEGIEKSYSFYNYTSELVYSCFNLNNPDSLKCIGNPISLGYSNNVMHRNEEFSFIFRAGVPRDFSYTLEVFENDTQLDLTDSNTKKFSFSKKYQAYGKYQWVFKVDIKFKSSKNFILKTHTDTINVWVVPASWKEDNTQHLK
jgi:hypothetical protein